MNIKICFGDEIHKVALPPSTFASLKQDITSMFANSLPAQWKLYYIDSEAERITLSSEGDYSVFLESECHKLADKTTKIFIVNTQEKLPANIIGNTKQNNNPKEEFKEDTNLGDSRFKYKERRKKIIEKKVNKIVAQLAEENISEEIKEKLLQKLKDLTEGKVKKPRYNKNRNRSGKSELDNILESEILLINENSERSKNKVIKKIEKKNQENDELEEIKDESPEDKKEIRQQVIEALETSVTKMRKTLKPEDITRMSSIAKIPLGVPLLPK